MGPGGWIDLCSVLILFSMPSHLRVVGWSPWIQAFASRIWVVVVFFSKDFINLFMKDRKSVRDTGRGRRSRLHARTLMWDSIPDSRIIPWVKGRRSTTEPPRRPCFLDLKPLKVVSELVHEGLEEYTLAFLNHGDLRVVNTTKLSENWIINHDILWSLCSNVTSVDVYYVHLGHFKYLSITLTLPYLTLFFLYHLSSTTLTHYFFMVCLQLWIPWGQGFLSV